MASRRVYIGWDPNEIMAFNVARQSLLRYANYGVQVHRVARLELQAKGVYTRETTVREGHRWDTISAAPMSTDHAIARFFVPWLCDYQGWAVFMDGDVLLRDDIRKVFDMAEERYAVQVVKHAPFHEDGLKKTGAIQLAYPRKLWSSVVLWNAGHPANQALTIEALNTWPGRTLHGFRWLNDDQIGELPDAWNYLVGLAPMPDVVSLVHYTLGAPSIPGHEHDPFAEEWYRTSVEAGYRKYEVSPYDQV